MSGDLLFTVILDGKTGRITPASNMRGIEDMIRVLSALDVVASGIRQAVYDALVKESGVSDPAPAETDE